MISGSVAKHTRESIGLELAKFFDVPTLPLSKGSTLPTEFLRTIHAKVLPDGDKDQKIELVLDDLFRHYGTSIDSRDFSSGSTVTQHGYRKLLRVAAGKKYCFVLNYADHEVSSEYEDVLEESYGFSRTVTGKVPFLESGTGSRVVFYATSKCKTEPTKTYFACAEVSEIAETSPGQFRARLTNFERFEKPVSRNDVSIQGRNEQHGIVEITCETYDQITAAGHKNTGSLVQDEIQVLESETNLHRDQLWPIINSLLDSTPQVVLTGPPGTGKTFLAQKIAKYVLSDGKSVDAEQRVRVVQFHPSYGYEDFVEGLKPTSTGAGGLDFQVVPGVIMQLARDIEVDGLPRVLIIDEMNRANLPRVFGELMYLLEYRNKEISLAQTPSFKLSDKLMIIGTLNTADRSVQSIDLALRRRFDFFEVSPSVEILRKHFKKTENVNDLGSALFDGFEKLNNHLQSEIGDRHLLIGHSYFMKQRIDGPTLRSIWNQQLLPLIEDYFFDQPRIIEDFVYESYWG